MNIDKNLIHNLKESIKWDDAWKKDILLTIKTIKQQQLEIKRTCEYKYSAVGVVYNSKCGFTVSDGSLAKYTYCPDCGGLITLPKSPEKE